MKKYIFTLSIISAFYLPCFTQISFEHIGVSDKSITKVIITIADKQKNKRFIDENLDIIIPLLKKDFLRVKKFIKKHKKYIQLEEESDGYAFGSFKINVIEKKKSCFYLLYGAQESEFFFKHLIILLKEYPSYDQLLNEVDEILLRIKR